MPSVVVNYSWMDTGTVIVLGNGQDAWIGTLGLVVSSNGGATVRGNGGGHWITLAGQLAGGTAISLGGAAGQSTGHRVTLTSSALITADDTGIALNGRGAVIRTAGMIEAGDIGIALAGAAGPVARLSNSGTISGDQIGVERSGPAGLVLTNTGTITSPGDAIRIVNGTGAEADSRIVNRGQIEGAIRLADGDDLLDSRTGSIEGSIDLGAGNDRLLLGTGSYSAKGGAGADTASYQADTAGVAVALDDGFEWEGEAADDDLTGFENLIGGKGADWLRGDVGANGIEGGLGADRLEGEDGNDSLTGGRGTDTLTGGDGNDVFVFGRKAEGGDSITDFGASGGNNDAIQLLRAGFGLSAMTAGTLASQYFRSGTNAEAAYATDLFLFRTSDSTLWFDADGNGAKEAILIADLQDGAVLTHADILLA